MITNYAVMDEEFISQKTPDVCAGKQIITWSPLRFSISIIQRKQPPNLTRGQCKPGKSYENHFLIHANGARDC